MNKSMLLVSFAVLFYISPAHSLQRSRRDLSEDDSNYLTDMYNRFGNDENLDFEGWSQFAIMTIDRPDQLVPCPLDINVMNENGNYVAFTPVDRASGRRHAESRALGTLQYYVHENNPTRIYLFTYNSPCEDCITEIVNVANRYPRIRFYVGYIQEYTHRAAVTALLTFAGLANVYYGRINGANRQAPCHSELRRKRSDTCPVAPSCESGGKSGGCFPSTAVVHTNDPSSPTKSMDQLKVGDNVLATTNQGRAVFSPVIAFLDRLPSMKTEYIAIETEDRRILHLSPLHLIFCNSSIQPVQAIDILLGDYVYIVDPDNPDKAKRESKVVSIYKSSGLGAYAPLTMEGTVIVDSFVTSCYAEVNNQYRVHAAFAPLRFMHHVIPNMLDSSKQGVHWYANLLRQGVKYTRKYFPAALQPDY